LFLTHAQEPSFLSLTGVPGRFSPSPLPSTPYLPVLGAENAPLRFFRERACQGNALPVAFPLERQTGIVEFSPPLVTYVWAEKGLRSSLSHDRITACAVAPVDYFSFPDMKSLSSFHPNLFRKGSDLSVLGAVSLFPGAPDLLLL